MVGLPAASTVLTRTAAALRQVGAVKSRCLPRRRTTRSRATGPRLAGPRGHAGLLNDVADGRLNEITPPGLLGWSKGRESVPICLLARIGKTGLVTFGDLSMLLATSDRGSSGQPRIPAVTRLPARTPTRREATSGAAVDCLPVELSAPLEDSPGLSGLG
jgi:hypothetical protein